MGIEQLLALILELSQPSVLDCSVSLGLGTQMHQLGHATTKRSSDHPGHQDMLDRIKQRRDADYVIVATPDRLSGTMRVRAEIEAELNRYGVKLIAVRDGAAVHPESASSPLDAMINELVSTIIELYEKNRSPRRSHTGKAA